VFFVPATINYLLTLEAETLIDDFLQEEGKHRYIIEDDESSRPARVAAFLGKTLGLDASCVVRFGHPLDCFGNRVEADGTSRDAQGHLVDPLGYLTDIDGRILHDPARDAQYTRELGDAIVGEYRKNTVVMATHLVAACAFARLREALRQRIGASADIFAMLRSHDDISVARPDLAADIEALRDSARDMEARGGIVLGPGLARASGREILDEALRAFAGYYTTPVLEPRGEDIVLVDTRLIFYYQNRLAAHLTGKTRPFALGSRAPARTGSPSPHSRP
jgi:glycerol-3-phosphate O-acyltransferase